MSSFLKESVSPVGNVSKRQPWQFELRPTRIWSSRIRVLMGLWWQRSLVCSINKGAGLGAQLTHVYMSPRETLAAATSRPNSKAQATHVALAHPCVVFHPCMCGFHGGTTTVAVVLINSGHVEVTTEMTIRRRQSWSTTSSTRMRDYVGLELQLLFRCTARLVVTIHDLLLTSIIGWHSRSSASVAYPFLYSGIRVILHSFGLDLLLHSFDWINRCWKEVEVDCVLWLNG
jgi:hypothetical protein